jgi:transcriptional regulator with XRE-family HTH domain
MRERIREFLKRENKTSSQFAEEIGIQPSGVSHVLSGRNKPSLDFILRMLRTYSDLNSDWLLFGKGEMYRTGGGPDLFDDKQTDESYPGKDNYKEISLFTDQIRKNDAEGPGEEKIAEADMSPEDNSSERIIVFHGDGTYSEYKRRK